jgi:hypothetical protein
MEYAIELFELSIETDSGRIHSQKQRQRPKEKWVEISGLKEEKWQQ